MGSEDFKVLWFVGLMALGYIGCRVLKVLGFQGAGVFWFERFRVVW